VELREAEVEREKHPTTPFAVISPTLSPLREATPNAVGFTLPAMRDEVASAVETLRAHGDAHVRYFDGRRLFGDTPLRVSPGNVHPNADGYKLLASKFLTEVAPHVFPV
jgi:lysophospholipase L1-like esterase